MDIKEIVKWSLKRWWWFLISVAVCLMLALMYYHYSTPKYEVRATLMMRQMSDKANDGDMMQMMGLKGNKDAGDEVRVLTSRDLLGRVVDELDLCTSYSVKCSGKWFEQFPQHDLNVNIALTKPVLVTIDVKVKGDSYRVKLKRYMTPTERFTITDLSQPIHTSVGDLHVDVPASITEGDYRVVIVPRALMVDMVGQQMVVNRLSRESNIITISSITDCPNRMTATINTLLRFYNQESTVDKNLLAVQTEQFLAGRIAVVEQELNDAEAALETYKRTQQIANLSKTADEYQKLGNQYEQMAASYETDLREIDYMLTYIEKPENAYSIIPFTLSEKNAHLETAVQNYNNHVAHRNELLQTATEQNVLVVNENEMLAIKRAQVKESLLQARQTLTMKRQFLLDQQQQYVSRLSSLPETERRYIEMSREKATKEKQYVYLIEKREENSLLLSSEAVPARIVEYAQQSSVRTSPKIRRTILFGVFLGMLLPFLVYVLSVLRKEYL